jgi:hypothetical protein
MSTLTKQAKQLSIPLAAALALGCVLLYLLGLKMPPPSYDDRSSTPLMSPPGPDPGIARSSTPVSSTPSHHVPPRMPELPMASFPERPTRFMPTGDPTTFAAQLLTKLIVEAQFTDEQQQLFFRLMWDAKQEWDLLAATASIRYWEMPQAIGDFYEHTNENIDRQMREVLTPEQWEVYDRFIPVTLFHEFPIGPEPGA